MGASLQQAHLCEQESCDLAMVVVRSLKLQSIHLATTEVAPDSAKAKSSTGTFKPTKDTKPV
jgi:hypothetical protein